MTRWLLDTNIVSEATRPSPSAALATWLAARNDGDLFLSTLTLAELHRGILQLPAGARRDRLATWFAGPEGPAALFANRILPFDERAALVWGDLMAEGKRAGRPRSGLDMIVAATAIANGCVLVTANERDFAGLSPLNPMRPD